MFEQSGPANKKGQESGDTWPAMGFAQQDRVSQPQTMTRPHGGQAIGLLRQGLAVGTIVHASGHRRSFTVESSKEAAFR